jgi:uncharacterized membrane protein SpoIIM required for sporulation
MIYLMTAFFLDFNHAAPVWWGGYITFVLLDIFVAIMNGTKKR